MERTKKANKEEQPTALSDEIRQGIEKHKLSAIQLNAAASYHMEAAGHHEAGDHDSAAESSIKAHGHLRIARKAQRGDVSDEISID